MSAMQLAPRTDSDSRRRSRTWALPGAAVLLGVAVALFGTGVVDGNATESGGSGSAPQADPGSTSEMGGHPDHPGHDDHDHDDHAVGDSEAHSEAGHDDHDDESHDDHDHDGHDAAGSPDGHDDHDHDSHDDSDAHDDHVDIVRLTAAEIAEFGVIVETAGSGVIEQTLEVPGEVRPNDDRLAHIVPRYSGIVTDVRVGIGDYVKRGQVLAIIESDESLAPFEVKTLLSGTVIGKHITLGEAASRDRDTFVIADLSTVWIDLTIYQRDLERVRVGQEVVLLRGHEERAEGKISYVTPIVDERTRTATARVVLTNRDEDWRPGMFVTGLIRVESAEVPLAIPTTAVHRVEGRAAVFVETADGFEPQPVVLGRTGRDVVEVLSGIHPGDRFVSEGGFTLKAELEKGSFGHGHAH